jgi:hypothetical protein
MNDLPDSLIQQRNSLLDEISQAFSMVSLRGGVSWRGAHLIDLFWEPMERALSESEKDWDINWLEPLSDPNWLEGGRSEWCFLDPIGFRFYLPSAMTLCVVEGFDAAGITSNLTLGDYGIEQWSALDASQRRCIRSFLRFMLALQLFTGDGGWPDWQNALETYWNNVE